MNRVGVAMGTCLSMILLSESVKAFREVLKLEMESRVWGVGNLASSVSISSVSSSHSTLCQLYRAAGLVRVGEMSRMVTIGSSSVHIGQSAGMTSHRRIFLWRSSLTHTLSGRV